MLDNEIDETQRAHLQVFDHLKKMPPNAGSLIEVIDLIEALQECLQRLFVISHFAVSVISRIYNDALDGIIIRDLHRINVRFVTDDYALDFLLLPVGII